MIKLSPYIICLTTLCFTFMGCIKDGVDGKNSLIDQIAEAPGANCPAGGYKIITGIDENRNNELDEAEIQKTEYMCNTNKETIIYFPGGGYTESTTPLLVSSSMIRDFNIANYNADSVVFAANAYTYMGGVTSTVELYDFTNNKVINNTTIKTDSDNPNWSYTTTKVNFLNDLPKSPINIGLRVTSGRNGGGMFGVYNPVLRLYKK